MFPAKSLGFFFLENKLNAGIISEKGRLSWFRQVIMKRLRECVASQHSHC
jgi:hypothetical protein